MSVSDFKAYLKSISGMNHASIPEPWGINYENAQFLEAVRVVEGCDNWNQAFQEMVISWLSKMDEEQLLNLGSHLDRSSSILARLIWHLKVRAEAAERAVEDIEEVLESLEYIHET